MHTVHMRRALSRNFFKGERATVRGLVPLPFRLSLRIPSEVGSHPLPLELGRLNPAWMSAVSSAAGSTEKAFPAFSCSKTHQLLAL